MSTQVCVTCITSCAGCLSDVHQGPLDTSTQAQIHRHPPLVRHRPRCASGGPLDTSTPPFRRLVCGVRCAVMTRLMPRPIAGLCASFTSCVAAYTLLARFDSPGPLYCCCLRLRHGRKGGAGVIAFDTALLVCGVLTPSTQPVGSTPPSGGFASLLVRCAYVFAYGFALLLVC